MPPRMSSKLPLNLADLLCQRTVEGDRIEYKAGHLGGPAACAAPAGSRSDKRLRRVGSTEKSTFMPGRCNCQRHRTQVSGRRGLLSLRDPTALTGRSGHPGK